MKNAKHFRNPFFFRIVQDGPKFLAAMPLLPLSLLFSEIMIPSSIKLCTKRIRHIFQSQFIGAAIANGWEFLRQNSNMFSFISGNLWLRTLYIFNASPPVSGHVSVKVYVFVYLFVCVCICAKLCTFRSMGHRREEEINEQQCPFCRLIYCQNGSLRSISTANKNKHLIQVRTTKWAET